MTDASTPTAETASIDELPDPEALRDQDDVPFEDSVVVNDADHLELNEPIDGRVIVGLTDDDGRLLLSTPGCGDAWLLPHAPVEPGEDYAAVARRDLAERVGTDVVIAGVERVLHKEFRLEDDEDRSTSVYHVVVSASPEDDAAVPADSGSDEATTSGRDEGDAPDHRWFGAEPPVLPDGDPLDDLELFLD